MHSSFIYLFFSKCRHISHNYVIEIASVSENHQIFCTTTLNFISIHTMISTRYTSFLNFQQISQVLGCKLILIRLYNRKCFMLSFDIWSWFRVSTSSSIIFLCGNYIKNKNETINFKSSETWT